MEVYSHTSGEFVSNIFTIPKKNGGNRPVIDMRGLSRLVEYTPFRMEDISLLKPVLKQGDFMTKHDSRDAYLTLQVDNKLRIYLRFCWRGVLLPIHLPSFRSLFFRLNFHQSNEVSDSICKSHGYQIIIFSRQHFDHGKLSRSFNATHRLCNPGIDLLGFCDKQNPFSSLQRCCQT